MKGNQLLSNHTSNINNANMCQAYEIIYLLYFDEIKSQTHFPIKSCRT